MNGGTKLDAMLGIGEQSFLLFSTFYFIRYFPSNPKLFLQIKMPSSGLK